MPYEDGLLGKCYQFKPEDFRHVHFMGKQGPVEAMYDMRNCKIRPVVNTSNFPIVLNLL